MAMRPVLQSYRYLLRTNKQVFASDPHAIQHSLQCIRDEYRKNANVSDPKAVEKLVADAYEAGEFAKTHLIQAKRKDESTYAITLSQEHAELLQDGDVDLSKTVPDPPGQEDNKPCGGGQGKSGE